MPGTEGAPPAAAMPLVEPSLDLALARAGDGAFVIGADSRIVLWNRSAEKILGYTSREVIGRPCCDVFVGATRTTTASATRAVTS